MKNQHKSERSCEISGNIPGKYLLSLPWVLTFLLESLRSYLDTRLLAFWLCVIGSWAVFAGVRARDAMRLFNESLVYGTRHARTLLSSRVACALASAFKRP